MSVHLWYCPRRQPSLLTPLLFSFLGCSGSVDDAADPFAGASTVNVAPATPEGVIVAANPSAAGPGSALPGALGPVPAGSDGLAPMPVDGAGSPVGSDGLPGPVTPEELPELPAAGEPGGTRVVPTMELDQGRVVLRRLNRAEYDNTVRDLLGTSLTPAQDGFAPDDVEEGFDTIGNRLVVSLLLAEQLDAAANQLVDELLGRPEGDPTRDRILVCDPTSGDAPSCNEQILAPLMKNAFRRPVTSEEVQQRVDLAAQVQMSTSDPLRGLRAALNSVLLSPHFLYRVELGDPTSDVATPLSEYELASRLSYFLWASMPDQQLLDAAEAQALSRTLDAQVDRMLADPKAQGFIDSFVGQWLSTREASGFAADGDVFPSFDDALRVSMAEETKLFFGALIQENQPLSALVLADFSFVNARLAQHYELPGGQTEFTRVALDGSPRMGLLTQETFLTVTSYSFRTSPVRRADWILEHLLCDPPPAAPPMIPALEAAPPESGLTLREVFERHRQEPSCASCHQIMDPIGFALENFDAIGAYRTLDNGAPVDASGQLVDGTPINGVEDLAQAIASDADYAICLGKQMLTYAVGRSFSETEARAYAAGVGVSVKDGTWPDLIHAVANSQAFLTRRGETL